MSSLLLISPDRCGTTRWRTKINPINSTSGTTALDITPRFSLMYLSNCQTFWSKYLRNRPHGFSHEICLVVGCQLQQMVPNIMGLQWRINESTEQTQPAITRAPHQVGQDVRAVPIRFLVPQKKNVPFVSKGRVTTGYCLISVSNRKHVWCIYTHIWLDRILWFSCIYIYTYMDCWYGRRDVHDVHGEPLEVILSCWTCWELQKFQIMDLRSNALLTTSWLVLSPRWSFKHWSRPTIGYDASTDFHAFQLDLMISTSFRSMLDRIHFQVFIFCSFQLYKFFLIESLVSMLVKRSLTWGIFFSESKPARANKNLWASEWSLETKTHRILHASSSSPNLTVRKCETIAGWFKHSKKTKHFQICHKQILHLISGIFRNPR